MTSTHLNYGQLYGPHPDYGNGVYRRGVRLVGEEGRVLAEMEDSHHAMRVSIEHDGDVVMAIESNSVRVPTTMCTSAATQLKVLIGARIADLPISRYRGGAARSQCTHLFDLAVLAIAHASRGSNQRRYDVVVPDDTGEGVVATITLNGVVVHAWQLVDLVIQSPEPFVGQSLLRGFVPWVVNHLDGDALEAALILQMGFFVAQARRKDFGPANGTPIAANLDMYGRCFAYQPEHRERATHIDSTVDLSADPERVLAFKIPAKQAVGSGA